jgi:hypothetical protein
VRASSIVWRIDRSSLGSSLEQQALAPSGQGGRFQLTEHHRNIVLRW